MGIVQNVFSCCHRRDQQPSNKRLLEKLGFSFRGTKLTDNSFHPVVFGHGFLPRENKFPVVQPIFVPGGFITEPFFEYPLHQVSSERSEGRPKQDSDRRIPVSARPHQLDIDVRNGDPSSGTNSWGSVDRGRHHVGLTCLQGRSLSREVDVLT